MSLIGGNLIVYLTADTTQYDRGMSKAKSLTDSFRDSAKIAAGVLMRDLVRGLTQGAVEALKMGAQIRTLKNSFDSLRGATAGYVPDLDRLRKATQGMVSDTDLLLRANEAMALGIPTEKLDELFDSAIRLGKAMGIDATQGIQALTIGVGRQSRLVLDNLGIIVKAEEAYTEYAKRIGKTTETLTENERRLAFQTIALEKISEKAAILGDNISDTDKVMDQWSATIANVTTGLGKLLGPLGVLSPLLTTLAPAISIIAVQALPMLVRSLYGMLPPLVAVEAALIPLLLPLLAITTAIVALGFAWETNFLGIKDVTANIVGYLKTHMGGLKTFIENITKAMEPFFKIIERIQDAIHDVKTLMFGPAPGLVEVTYKTVSGRSQIVGVDETAQHGFSGIVSKPTVILAGEAGPEMVSITPLSRGVTASGIGSTSPSGDGGYSPTFVFNIDTLSGDRAGAQRLGQLTAEEHLNELKRRGKTL